jgi:hypothetical protein
LLLDETRDVNNNLKEKQRDGIEKLRFKCDEEKGGRPTRTSLNLTSKEMRLVFNRYSLAKRRISKKNLPNLLRKNTPDYCLGLV